MINISKKKDCCGCNACGDVCPKHSITFKIDKEGFWYPEVEMDTCIDCHLCEKVCPLLNKEEYKNIDGYVKPKTYALVHKNIEVRFDSTSGGAFTALAEEVYKQGGFVGGAIYNEDWSVSQFLSSSKNDLPKLRSSKYLQSHFDGFYKSVKEALKTEKPVLVCGSPCQMAAMFRYLKKPYENLIIVDYICRGIASPMYFRKWINYLENKHNSKVIFYKAKSKELGWRKLSTRIEYANGEADVIAGHDNPWLMMQYKVPEICRHWRRLPPAFPRPGWRWAAGGAAAGQTADIQNLHDAAPKAEDAGHRKAQLQSGLGTVQRGGGNGAEVPVKKTPEEGENHQTGPDIRHCHRSTLTSIDFEKWVHCNCMRETGRSF